MFKKLTLSVLTIIFTSVSVASAEPEICTEVEWWSVEGLTEAPFVSFDPDFRSGDNGDYRPGASLEPLNGEPCRLKRELPTHAEGTMKVTSLFCSFPVNGEARGRLRDARDGYFGLKEQLEKCSVLQDWRIREDESYSRYATKWSYPGTEQLTLMLRSQSLYTPDSSDLDLSLERVEFASKSAPARSGTTEPEATQTVRPRNVNQWANRIADAYPEIATRLGWKGTVGVLVIVGMDGKPVDCIVTSSSGWPILDHTACKSMTRFARFYPAEDADGNPEYGRYTTSIAYQFE